MSEQKDNTQRNILIAAILIGIAGYLLNVLAFAGMVVLIRGC